MVTIKILVLEHIWIWVRLGGLTLTRGPSTRIVFSLMTWHPDAASHHASQPGFIQHSKQASWFFKFLATIMYDHVINPCYLLRNSNE